MDFRTNRPIRFAVQFLPLFLLFLWLYPIVLPAYRGSVQFAANAVMSHLSPPTRIASHAHGGFEAFVSDEAGNERTLSTWNAFVVHLIFLSLLFLPPLLLASPTTVLDRLRLLAVGLALLYLIHMLALIGLVRARHCLLLAPGTRSCLWMLRLIYTSGQISGALLWAALTWKFWIPESWLSRETAD